MKHKRTFLILLMVIVIPQIIVFTLLPVLEFNLGAIETIVLGQSSLLCGEIMAHQESRKLIWGLISRSRQDKLAFASSLAIFYFTVILPSWLGLGIPSSLNGILWVFAGMVVSTAFFLSCCTNEVRKLAIGN
ncbi:hypothetical protein FBQ99_02685 [Chloroflexi bacterium CFX2]|nr:hypothetical protein [Chloroflexi bacterium CFX2]